MRKFPLLAGVTVLVAAANVFAGGTLTNGNATFDLIGTPSTNGSGGNSANFRPEGGATTDHQFFYQWGYRAPSSNQNQGMSNLVTPTESYVGNTGTVTWVNNGPGPIGFNRFDAQLVMTLLDGATAGEATLNSALSFTAATSNTAPVTFQIFHVADIDLNGTLGGDVYTVNNPAGVSGFITDTLTTPAARGDFSGTGANLFQVGGSTPIRSIVNGSSSANLNNTASFSGDGAYAFQWTVTLAPGAQATFNASFSTVVPEPASLGLLGLAIPMALRRRR